MDGKRKLPSWMAGVSTVGKVSRSLEVETNASVVAEQTKSKSQTARRRKEARIPSEEAQAHEGDGSGFLVKCETKRRKRIVDVIDSDDRVREIGIKKTKHGRIRREVQERDPPRKKKAKSYGFESSDEIEPPSPEEHDDDLTMEDMLSIAQEFVKNGSDTGQQESSQEQCTSKRELGHTSSSRRETGIPPTVPRDTGALTHDETASRHDRVEDVTLKVTLADSQITGDPTHDMLELFLGPLLNKPIANEQARSLTDDITHLREFKKQQKDVIVPDKPVVLEKKKTSLRDTVSMLLD